MSGPFKPDAFSPSNKQPHSYLDLCEAAEQANRIDAKRWACPEGGEHEPVYLATGDGSPYGEICEKCGAKLRPRWEAM